MKHRIGYNRLGRKTSHRKALIKNMVTQLYRHERIRTTRAKALEVRRKAEKLITKAKEDTVHNRRIVTKLIQDKEILAKLFTDIAPAFSERPGGYTRILKLGYRKGDAAEMVILELVERDEEAPSPKQAKKAPVETEEPVEEAADEAPEEESAEAVEEPETEEEDVPAEAPAEAGVEESSEEQEEDESESAEKIEAD